MILAAAAYARWKPRSAAVGQPPEIRPQAPRELRLALDVRSWGALPVSGGLLDQPAGLLDKMRYALSVYEAVISYESRNKLETVKWKEAHAREWQGVQEVNKLRAEHGG